MSVVKVSDFNSNKPYVVSLSGEVSNTLVTLFENSVVSKIMHAYSALPTTHVVNPGVIFTVYNPITITVLKQKNAYLLHTFIFLYWK